MAFARQTWVKGQPLAELPGTVVRSPPYRNARRGSFNAFRWLLTREAIVNLALIAVMIAVVWSGIWLHLEQQRREAGSKAARDSSNLAQAASESIGQTISGVEDALRFMSAIYSSDPKHFDVGAWASRVNRTRSVALEFAVIGQDGKLISSSLGPVTTPLDFSTQEFYLAQSGDAPDRLFISKPILGRTSGRWSLLFTWKIIAVDGWFMGVIAASVDPSWLTRLHETLDIGHGSLMLIGTDGVIRALASGSAPDPGKSIGLNLADSALADAASAADRGTLTWRNPVDGMEQIVSFRRLAEYSSIVAVGLDAGEVFAPYLLYARQYEIFGFCLSLLILLAGCLLLGNTRRILVSRQVLKDTMDAISQGIVMADAQGRVRVINRRATEFLRIPSPLTDDNIESGTIVNTRPLMGDLVPAEKQEADHRPRIAADTATDYEQTYADGTVLEIRTHALGDGDVVRTYTDITERKNAEARIIHMALHDSITGLPNRRAFTECLVEAIRRADKRGEPCAVLRANLDRFKHVNDMHGHALGDRVLLQVADRLRGLVRGTDTVARFGGDEFCILQAAADSAASETLARDLVNVLSRPYRIGDQEVLLSASVGIAFCPAHGSSVDQLLSNADTALYRAKEGGRNTFRLYEPEMDIRIVERRLLEQELKTALALEQLSVFYQPIFDGVTCEVSSFEALVRWPHATRGNISPVDFIPVAEDSGLIVELGHWVLAMACAEAMQWPSLLRVAVNLSPKQFLEPDLVERVAATLAATGLRADRLTLEVTEGVFIDNSELALSAISGLKDQGVQVTLDDFGTGFSSLSYLHRFPFDCIKIDRSFINTLCENEGSRAIVQTILALGRSLRLKVVAEGVEDQAQLQWLRSARCDEIQGFLLGRPMPREEVRAFLAKSGTFARRVEWT